MGLALEAHARRFRSCARRWQARIPRTLVVVAVASSFGAPATAWPTLGTVAPALQTLFRDQVPEPLGRAARLVPGPGADTSRGGSGFVTFGSADLASRASDDEAWAVAMDDGAAEQNDTLPDNCEFTKLLQGGFSKEKLLNFFASRPFLVAQRLGQIGDVFLRVQSIWNRPGKDQDRGAALRKGLCELGPVFVKMGQTLAQREDLVGDAMAAELKKLQANAEPFPDEEAHKAILLDLNHRGPLAPGVCPEGCDPSLPPLFASITEGPVAAASLGQVYRATTPDGRQLAVKVQRPNAAQKVALDWTCGHIAANFYRSIVRAYNDMAKIADQVARGVFLELDYHNEARNMAEFLDMHQWLGFVTAPKFVPEYSGPKGTARVLSTEWVNGTPIDKLSLPVQRNAVRLTMQAAIVQLLLTGFVHADPHEGNLLYTEDGHIAFLDFGLVDRLEPWVMEGFAEGMVAIQKRRWADVARAMQAVKWVPDPVKKNLRPGQVGPEYVDCDFGEFVEALAKEMERDSEAQRSFGGLAAAVQRMSRNYLILAPPYVILLTRTFVTLEGLVARVDPDFSVFSQAMPVTLRRLVSPTTEQRRRALRDTVLTADGELRWDALEGLLNITGVTGEHRESEQVADSLEFPGVRSAEPWGVLQGLLGSADGGPLRRLAYEVDAKKAVRYLASERGRPWRRKAAKWLAERWGRTRLERARSQSQAYSEEVARLHMRWHQRQRRALGLIARSHLSRLGGLGQSSGSLLVAFIAGLLVARVAGGAAGILLLRRFRSLGTLTSCLQGSPAAVP